jgi:hypothetical protein
VIKCLIVEKSTCKHVEVLMSLENEVDRLARAREDWVAGAVLAGMSEADARATAAKMTSFTKGATKPVMRGAARRGRASKPADGSALIAAAGRDKTRTIGAVDRSAGEIDSESLQLTLPGFQDDLRAIPNHLARSPLFAPIKPGRRMVRVDELLPSPDGVTVRYSGPQLDQADCDVFMQLIYEQRGKPLGAQVSVVRQNFLHSIGRADGGKNYDWLQSVMDRLQAARVRVENNRYVLTAQLLGKVIQDKVTSTFQVVLDPDIVEMFAPGDRSLVDWQKRLMIERRVDLAKWLHNFTASHKDRTQYHSLANLRAWSGYASPLRKFREAVEEALQELARVEVISGHQFYERKSPTTKKLELMVRWDRQ